jgi:hypothetical protein
VYDRSRSFAWLFTSDKGTLDNITGIKKKIAPKVAPKLLQRRVSGDYLSESLHKWHRSAETLKVSMILASFDSYSEEFLLSIHVK